MVGYDSGGDNLFLVLLEALEPKADFHGFVNVLVPSCEIKGDLTLVVLWKTVEEAKVVLCFECFWAICNFAVESVYIAFDLGAVGFKWYVVFVPLMHFEIISPLSAHCWILKGELEFSLQFLPISQPVFRLFPYGVCFCLEHGGQPFKVVDLVTALGMRVDATFHSTFILPHPNTKVLAFFQFRHK